jgi:hypothetical protein
MCLGKENEPLIYVSTDLKNWTKSLLLSFENFKDHIKKTIIIKKLLVTGMAVVSIFLMTPTGGTQAQESLEPGGGAKCRSGERCPTGTYNYCDTLASDDRCVCHNCTKKD